MQTLSSLFVSQFTRNTLAAQLFIPLNTLNMTPSRKDNTPMLKNLVESPTHPAPRLIPFNNVVTSCTSTSGVGPTSVIPTKYASPPRDIALPYSPRKQIVTNATLMVGNKNLKANPPPLILSINRLLLNFKKTLYHHHHHYYHLL